MEDLKKKIVEVGKKLVKLNLTYLSFGNISVRKDNLILITPTGIDFEELSYEDIVELDLNGKVLNNKRPSIEYRMHLEIYKIREDVNAIIHFHPLYATILAVSKEELEPILEEHYKYLGKREIRVAPYSKPGSIELAKNVAHYLGEANAVLIHKHGAVCVGYDLDMALKSSLILEREAMIYVFSRILSLLKKDDIEDILGSTFKP